MGRTDSFENPDAGNDWKQEEKGTAEHEMVGLHPLDSMDMCWVGSWSWRWTGRPGMLQSTGSQSVRHEWVTELNWTQKCFLLGKKAMINLDSVLKIRNFTLPTEVRIVKDMIFSVVMYGCGSWNIKKAERCSVVPFSSAFNISKHQSLMLLYCGVR